MEIQKTRHLKVDVLAEAHLQHIQIYISRKFGDRRGKRYLKELLAQLSYVTLFPAQYPFLDRDSNTHKCVFQSLTIILYRFDDTTVYIDDICDARSGWDGEVSVA
jgi:plasmid stabilization system protein ParE